MPSSAAERERAEADACLVAVERRVVRRVEADGDFGGGGQAALNARLAAVAWCKGRTGELACRWIADVPDTDLRMALAQQAWQEFHHQVLIDDRLGGAGGAAVPGGWEACLGGAEREDDWLARVAYLHVAFERRLMRLGRDAVRLAGRLGDAEAAALLARTIEPDDAFHLEIGRLAVRRYATTARRRQVVEAAVDRCLAVDVCR